MIRSCVIVCLAACTVSARTVESFNDGWTLERDGQTEAVSLPHDWAIAGPFDVKDNPNTGMLPWKGEGVYRKIFVLGERPQGRVFLDFDGVQGRSTVFVNGEPAGKGEYGYLGFRVDATPYLKAGTNTVEVTCDTRALFSRWYPGAGIYRKVSLVKTDNVYIDDDSIQIETTTLGKTWSVRICGKIVSRCAETREVTVSVALGERQSGSSKLEIEGFGEKAFALTLEVENPRLWQMEPNAALYDLVLRVTGEDFTDALTRRIGFREFAFDAEKGFILNGRRVQLKGVDLHSDLGPLGMAFDKDAMRRQLSIMRDMGVNALRTSHNCPAPEVLDLCDEMGIFVWDECFDKWNDTCGRGDEPLEDFVSRTLARWVRRDRTHPSVFAWSMGNEIGMGGDTKVATGAWMGKRAHGTTFERCARFREVIRAEDATRPVAMGCCFVEAAVRGDLAPLDLTGWNYREQYKYMKKEFPAKPVLYSESASAYSDYGYYQFEAPTNWMDYAWAEASIDSYDRTAAVWADIPDREFARMERDTWCCGEFVWAGIDYLGEPSPYTADNTTPRGLLPSRSSYFGICDLCVLPKDRFYLYRSHWNTNDFTLHLVPDHWTFPERVGKTVPVHVYTSADEAELFLNGRSLGRRRKNPTAGSFNDNQFNVAEYYSILPRYRLIWNEVIYEPGELKVVAYGASGEVLGEEILKTAGKPTRVVLTPEKTYGSLIVVPVTLADKNGTPVPRDNRVISFAAEGCEVVAVGNSNPRGLDSFKAVASHPLHNGRAAVYVHLRPGAKATLTAVSPGLTPAKVCLER